MIEERAFCPEKQAEKWENTAASQVRTCETASGMSTPVYRSHEPVHNKV